MKLLVLLIVLAAMNAHAYTAEEARATTAKSTEAKKHAYILRWLVKDTLAGIKAAAARGKTEVEDCSQSPDNWAEYGEELKRALEKLGFVISEEAWSTDRNGFSHCFTIYWGEKE